MRRQIRRALVRRFGSRPQAADFEIDWIWSKGVGRFCDSAADARYWAAETEAVQSEAFFAERFGAAAGLVWIRLGTGARDGWNNDLDHFAAVAVPAIRSPFVLVTTDGDASVPADLRPETVAAIRGSPFFRGWATQNWDGTGGPLFRPFPIGFDFHSPRLFTSPRRLARDLFAIADRAAPVEARPLRIFCDAHLSLASDERGWIARHYRGVPHIDMLPARIGQTAIWRAYARASFVVSPSGNGIDCHRTWEALALGAIAVVRRSSIDPLFEGLAVLVVDDWAELLDGRDLARRRAALAPLTRAEHVRPRLRAHFHLDPLRGVVASQARALL
ncbi:hypothetical protein [Prosthecomicrobium pneumaticum]|uniref:Exostosin GT47 domain-containing protein n=1 Tax=Prosthecomicrobium pneumaticum TaxID=81895 RepID=A0A7W9FQD2_9HYPH|nr:hypothetical protein [Prosthecomicrobium pneumaticum]MBB5754890.1 hypothetical protein [Prosthecomicrobium pneumaticum]